MVFTKNLICLKISTNGTSNTDKLTAPQSLLSELIDYFSNNDNIESGVESVSKSKKSIFDKPYKNRDNTSSPRILSTRKGKISPTPNYPNGISPKSNESKDVSMDSESESSSDETTQLDSNNNIKNDNSNRKEMKTDQIIPSPLTFEIFKLDSIDSSNALKSFPVVKNNKVTSLCVGIRDFDGPEGCIGVPEWIMEELGIEEGDPICLKYISLEKGTFAQLEFLESREMHKDLDIRSILEAYMRKNLTALVLNQLIMVPSAHGFLKMKVNLLEPKDKVEIVDTDLSVDIIYKNNMDINTGDLNATINNGFKSEEIKDSKNIGKSLRSGTEMEMGYEESGNNSNVVYKEAKNLDNKDEYYIVHENQKIRKTISPDNSLWFVFNINTIKGSKRKFVATVECLNGDVNFLSRKGIEKPSLMNFEKSDFSGPSEKKKSINLDSSETNSDYGNVYSFLVSCYGGEEAVVTIQISGDTDEKTENLEKVDNKGTNGLGDSMDDENLVICSNCLNGIPKASFQLHEVFCRRNIQKCDICGKPVSSKDLKNGAHNHCDKCDFVGFEKDVEKHKFYNHGSFVCPQCPDLGIFESIYEFNVHRQTICPGKTIVCRFCHTLVEQGGAPYIAQDILDGFHEHESYCGSRTIPCAICGKNVQLRKIKLHGASHDAAKQAQGLPFLLCANTECYQPRAGSVNKAGVFLRDRNLARIRSLISDETPNVLNLCAKCYAPLMVVEVDEDGKKILQRVVKALHNQLIHGCKQISCKNQFCATGNSQLNLSPTEAAKKLVPIITSLAQQVTNSKKNVYGISGYSDVVKISLCVDVSTQLHKEFVEVLKAHFTTEGGFGENKCKFKTEWIALSGIKTNNNFEESIKWLNLSAPLNK
ncbi:hypothetical protein BB559_001494 [Furculomyces boomerangus]|uniref:Uncharacterized protein n=1 Tax=Furculomyces boomerangus TaxID=61424 RepID=A0A2T9Z1T1_9FUNG|nr:hypothetical protein BB559_001494 [Furculomyces boomerangus]